MIDFAYISGKLKDKDILEMNVERNYNFGHEYSDLANAYRKMCDCLDEHINGLIDKEKIALAVPVEHRIKSLESIIEKIDRKSINVESIKDLNDVIGFRIILLFDRDKNTVSNLIEDTFDIVEKEDTIDRLDVAQFGYGSRHYVVKLPEGWLKLPSYKGLVGIRAEIQVRTAAQHIWAAASHLLQYKHEASVPFPLKRAISRVSAILEIVDVEFSRLLEERDAYIREIGNISIEAEINVDILERIMDRLLPASNKDNDENYDSLVLDLEENGIKTRGELESFIRKHIDKALSIDREQVAQVIEDGAESYEEMARANRGAYFTQTGLIRIMLTEHARSAPIAIDDLPL